MFFSTWMTYVKNILIWLDPGGQMMDMTQAYSFSWQKGNFPGKTKNNRICLKYTLNMNMLKIYAEYFSFINFDDISQKRSKWA